MPHVLKHLRMHTRQIGRLTLESGQIGTLACKANRLATRFPRRFSFRKRVIETVATRLHRLYQTRFLSGCQTQLVDERFQSRVLCASIYRRIVSDETCPAVLMKYERVHSDGMRRKIGNSSRKTRLDVPFSRAMICLGAH